MTAIALRALHALAVAVAVAAVLAVIVTAVWLMARGQPAQGVS